MAPSTATVPGHRLTAEDVMAMVRAGILDEDDRLELVDGVLVEMSPIGAVHEGAVDWLNEHFGRAADRPWRIRVQSTLLIGTDYVLPDLALVGPLKRTEQPSSALLVVEVAQTSQARDREKAATYARVEVPEYWIVDLPARTLAVHREPLAGAYRSVETFRDGATVQPLAPAAPAVEVTALLG